MKTTTLEKLNANLRQRLSDMLSCGCTQQSLADQLDIQQPHLSAFLSGRRKFQLDTLEKYAKNAGIRVEELF